MVKVKSSESDVKTADNPLWPQEKLCTTPFMAYSRSAKGCIPYTYTPMKVHVFAIRHCDFVQYLQWNNNDTATRSSDHGRIMKKSFGARRVPKQIAADEDDDHEAPPIQGQAATVVDTGMFCSLFYMYCINVYRATYS